MEKTVSGCAFTGHRNIPGSHIPRLAGLLDRAIEYAYGRGCRNFYCGGALGFDTMAERAIIKKRMKYPDIKLILVLPCIDQASKWSHSDKDAYEYVLSMADEVEYVSQEYVADCMKMRNARLVELCDILIAYVGRKIGGAAQTYRMAASLGKEIYNLFPKEYMTE